MEGSNRRELCRRFGISPPTGYKWLSRDESGEELDDRSRRPGSSPRRSEEAVEASVLKVRDDHPAWGARKIRAFLSSRGLAVPAASTIHAIFVDNGPPWGSSGAGRWTRLRVWLLKLGITLIYARPYHPESRGKNERFHRTMDAEILSLKSLRDARHAQAAFDEWRQDYNHLRPHEALGQRPPATRYTPSLRAMPAKLPEPDYETDAEVRRVPQSKDYIRFRGRFWKVPEAFRGEPVAIRPRLIDGEFGIYFGSHQIGTIDLTQPQCVNHVSEHP